MCGRIYVSVYFLEEGFCYTSGIFEVMTQPRFDQDQPDSMKEQEAVPKVVLRYLQNILS